jgi:23S rRNA (cytidine1920-2'-O)/16S rRNA (cytidine1409-2'-O)-methyltransferase
MRIDVFLFENGLAESRTEAKRLVLSGAVTASGKVISKPSYDYNASALELSVDKSVIKYASRGGFKLEGALSDFGIDPTGRIAIDVGASSGGFTDCLLQNGAKHVIAVDSGSGQIADFLRNSDSVTVLENFNARYMKPSDFEFTPSLAVMDVSFISATYIIPAVYDVLSDNSDFICLIKPQFEVGKASLGKGGIVKDKKALDFAKSKVSDFAKEIGFKHIKTIESPIKGGDGNTEYLAYFRKEMKNE